MTRKELKYLEDVRITIDDLQQIVGVEKKFEKFYNNKMLRYAVERQFEIIGEAIKNFKTLNAEIEITNSKEIIGLRKQNCACL